MNNGDGFLDAPGPPVPCPTCGAAASIDPTTGTCPRCGRGSWFTWSDDGERVLHPKGDLILADPLDRFLKSVEFQPGERLVLDLSDVHYIGSEALGRLLALRKRLLNVNGRLILRRLDADLLEILHVTRVDSFFEIEP